jgi:RNA 2',3'-cyclic 3'-phosphodiesterase
MQFGAISCFPPRAGSRFMRLFVALDLPDAVRQSFGELVMSLKPKSHAARWIRLESMHVTLKFLGHTQPSKLNSILDALGFVHSAGAIDLRFRGLGFFPDERHPHVIWSGVEAQPALQELVAAIENALEPLGFERERRTFFPHITLARLNSNNGAKKLVAAAETLKSYDFGSTRESEFHLFESFTKSSGAEYKKLATFLFVKESQ